MQPVRSLMGTLKKRLRNNRHSGNLETGTVEHQDDLERRLQRPVDEGDQQPAAIGGN